MDIYQTDEGGYYVGTLAARESPLEPGVFLIPRLCVTVAPPGEIDPGNLARWTGSAWEIVPAPVPVEGTPTPPDPRSLMSVYRLAWEDACSLLPYNGHTLLDEIDGILAVLASVAPFQARRYGNVTQFERLKPEVSEFLQSATPGFLMLSDTAVDIIFQLGAAIEGGTASIDPAHAQEYAVAQFHVTQWNNELG